MVAEGYRVADLLVESTAALHSSDSARLDAELLIAHCLCIDRTTLYRDPQRTISNAESDRLASLVDKRRMGYPIAQLTGAAEFWSLPLAVNQHVLVPRPETEHLVEQALACCDNIAYPLVADLGTGSGAVALAIASERRTACLVASDRSLTALSVAQHNAAQLRLSNIVFLNTSWLNSFVDRSLDLIVSNPPYVERHDPRLTETELRFEPSLALDGGDTGLDAYHNIIPEGTRVLRPGGWMCVEHGAEQGSRVRELFSSAGYRGVRTVCDFGGRERITLAMNVAMNVGMNADPISRLNESA